jgi:hypothetical protein
MQNDIIYNKRKFTIIDTESVSKYPNIQKERPDVESLFIAQGNRGSIITGYILNNGSFIIF